MGKDGSKESRKEIVMSEDALVNISADRWPSQYRAALAVRSMQTKLHDWAVRDPGRRFDDIWNLVYDPAFLTAAFERVASNQGARTAGVDRVTVTWIISSMGKQVFLEMVRDQLRSGTFTPVPVRQVMIPKRSGKLRALGIPTVTDRVVQAALKLVLEPIFEADFAPCSYGFRPNRRAQDAIAEIHYYTSRSYEWVLEADITACFDRIDHTALMERVRARIKDKHVLKLVKAFLKAGVMTTAGLEETHTGTPQGGILSPLLANIALSILDDHFMNEWHQHMATGAGRAARRRHGQANYRLIRYADDFVIVVAGERADAEQLQHQVAHTLAPLGLELSPEKTRVVHIDQGFDFLGFNIKRMKKPGSRKSFVYTRPSTQAIARVKDKIKTMTYRSTRHLDPCYLMERIGLVVRGWANYYRYGVSKRVFSMIDHYAWARITSWIRKKHHIGWPELKHKFCVPGTWLLTCDGHRFRGAASVPVTRYRYRGYHILGPWDQTAAITG